MTLQCSTIGSILLYSFDELNKKWIKKLVSYIIQHSNENAKESAIFLAFKNFVFWPHYWEMFSFIAIDASVA